QCPLCRRTINFLHKQDRHHRLQFASLEGKTAHTYLIGKHAHFRTLNTVVFLEAPSGRLSIRGRAVFSILGKLGGYWSLMSWMHHLPFIDHLYRLIAHSRKRGGALPPLRAPLLP
ncbi:MAG: thiol-disulfide oxidoreductase DCC family protein, partial [Rhabdochlamydiaceae bacterium]